MNASEGPAAPESGTFDMDPEIAALLDFEPVVRKRRVAGGWTPELQRRFVANIARMGSRTKAAEALAREVAGASKLCRAVGGESFRAACDAALDLYEERQEADAARNPGRAWGEPLRSRRRGADDAGPQPGQLLNEHGEWEDEEEYVRRGEDACDRVSSRLNRVRRLFLKDISSSPSKRAAFEIITEFPVDWEKAARGLPQENEPFSRQIVHRPDIILAAEGGWMGDVAHGRNRWAERKKELKKEIDAYHAEQGWPPIEWEEGWEE